MIVKIVNFAVNSSLFKSLSVRQPPKENCPLERNSTSIEQRKWFEFDFFSIIWVLC